MGFKQQMLLVSFRPGLVVATVGTTEPTKWTTKNGWKSICVTIDANTLTHTRLPYVQALKGEAASASTCSSTVRVSRQHMVDWDLQHNQNHDWRLNAKAIRACPGGILSVLLGTDRPRQVLALCCLAKLWVELCFLVVEIVS